VAAPFSSSHPGGVPNSDSAELEAACRAPVLRGSSVRARQKIHGHKLFTLLWPGCIVSPPRNGVLSVGRRICESLRLVPSEGPDCGGESGCVAQAVSWARSQDIQGDDSSVRKQRKLLLLLNNLPVRRFGSESGERVALRSDLKKS